MSQTIDNRVVQLEFDNSGFEENAQESLTTLQKLKQSLNLDQAAKNLTALGSAASRFTMDGISTACEQVADKFSYMKYMGLVALSNLVTGAMQAGSRIANALIGPITSGGWNRAMNLEQANFMMRGLLETEEEIEAVMTNVNKAVDQTAYSLDAAAKVAAQFTASGMKAGDSMEMALKAIAGTAAMTNSSFEEIGDIFTTVKGQGKLMAYQMNQLSFRGLNTAATLGRQLGKTEEEIRDMVSKGKIDFETFSNAMYKAFGEHAKEANNTFTGAMSNVRAALGRIGAEFATPFIRDMIPVLNSFRLAVNATKATLTPFFDVFASVTKSLSNTISKNIDSYTNYINKFASTIKLVFRDVIKSVTNLYNIVHAILTPIKEAYRDIFPQKDTLTIIKSLSKALVDVTTKIKELYFESNAADTIKTAFKGFFSIFDTGRIIILRTIGLIKQFLPIFDGFGGAIVTAITKVSEFLLGINESLKNSDFLMWDLSNIVDKIQEIGVEFRKVFDKSREKLGALEPKIQGIKEFIGSLFTSISEYLSKLIQGVKDIAGKDIFNQIIDHIKGGLNNIVNGITDLFAKLVNALSGVTSVLPNILDAITKTIAAVLKGILNGISGFLSSKELSDLTSSLKNGAIIKAFWSFAKSLDDLDSAIVNLNPKKLLESFTGITHLYGDANLISSLAKSILQLAGAMFILSIIDVDRFNAALDAMKTMFVSIGLILAMLKIFVPILNTTGNLLSKLFSKFTWSNIIPDHTIGLGTDIAAIAAGVLLLAFALKTLSSINPGKLTASIIAVGALMAILTTAVVIFAREITKMVKSLSLYGAGYKQFKKIASGLSRVMLSLVISILGLVAAVKILSNIPFTSMLKSLGALTVILAEMTAFCFILSKLNIEKTLGPAILKMSIGLIALAAALKIMASIPADQMATALRGLREGLAAITIALIALAGAMLIFSKLKLTGPSFTKLASALIIVSFSLIALGAALKILSTIDPEGMAVAINLLAVGMIAMTGSLVVLAVAAAGLEKNMSVLRKVNLSAIAASLLILSVALIAMSIAMKVLSTVKMDSIDLLVIFAGGLAAMTVALMTLANIPARKLLAAAGSLTLLTVTMVGLAAALALLAAFPFEKIGGAMLVLIGTIASLVAISFATSAVAGEVLIGAVAILAVLAAVDLAIMLFGKGIKAIGEGLILIGKGLAEIGVGVTIVAGAIAESLTETFAKLSDNLRQIKRVVTSLAMMGALSPLIIFLGVALLSVGAGLTLIGTGMNILAKGLEMMSKFMGTFVLSLKNAGDVIANSKTQVDAFINLILKLAILSLITPLLLLLAVGLLAVGGALVIFGAGLNLVMSGLALFSIAMEKLAQIDWEAVAGVISAIFEAVKAKIQAVIEWVQNIDWAAVWDVIKQAAAKVIDWFKNVDWSAVGAALLNALKTIGQKTIEFINTINGWIWDKIVQLWDYLKEKVVEGWEKVKEVISTKWEELKTWFSTKWEELKNSFDGWVEDIKEKGRNILAGFLEGLSEKWDDVKAWPGKVRDTILGGLDSDFDINSPSKESWYRGLFVAEGFNNGLEEGFQGTDSIVDEVANNTLGKLGGVGSKVADWLGIELKDSAEVADDSLSKLLGTVVDTTNFEWQESIPALEETWNKLGNVVQELQNADEKYHNGSMSTQEYMSVTGTLKTTLNELIGSFEDLGDAQDALGIKIGALKREQKEIQDAFTSHTISQKEAATRWKENARTLNTLTQIQQSMTKETKKTTTVTNEQTKATEANTKSTNTNTSSKRSAAKANKELGESLTQTLTNQLDIFKKFEAKNPMNKTELLNNMKSQIKGMTDWAGQMNKLAAMGIDQGLYKKLAEMGPQGAEYVGAFTQMTSEELAQANQLWAQSLTLPGDVAGMIANDFNNIGLNVDKGLAGGIAGAAGEVHDTTTKMVQENTTDPAMEVLEENSPSRVFNEIGFNVDMGLALGMQENANIPYNVIEMICKQIVMIAKRELNPENFKTIGGSVIQGVAQGIEENLSILETATLKMTSLIETVAKSKKGADINSPSKKMIPIGEAIGEGVAVGIDKSGRMVSSSVENLSDEAINSMKYTIASISAAINNEMEDPVIRPVLDLSNVQAGARSLNSIFSTNQSIKSGSVLPNLQNGQYSGTGNVIFNQNNYSPKALSRIDIYRDTKNIMSQYKQSMA